jgi:zinc finger SWIM domain-containing protein 3
VVLLRDLSNIRAKNRSRPDNELETAVQILDETKGVVVVAATEDRNLVGLFYQDLGMQQTFSEFPELLLIDATYKLNDLRMPLYLLMVVDSNGESEIVGTFLAADDTHDTIAIMIQTFKTNNPAWINVKAIMSDKDFVERNVMREEFPQASLLICLFHVLRTFRREVTCERMGIRASQRDLCLDILQQIVYSKSQDEYDQKVELLMATGLESVCTYFRNSWDPIKEEFVECFKGRALTLGNRTNNRLESINEKIKSVCSK